MKYEKRRHTRRHYVLSESVEPIASRTHTNTWERWELRRYYPLIMPLGGETGRLEGLCVWCLYCRSHLLYVRDDMTRGRINCVTLQSISTRGPFSFFLLYSSHIRSAGWQHRYNVHFYKTSRWNHLTRFFKWRLFIVLFIFFLILFVVNWWCNNRGFCKDVKRVQTSFGNSLKSHHSNWGSALKKNQKLTKNWEIQSLNYITAL